MNHRVSAIAVAFLFAALTPAAASAQSAKPVAKAAPAPAPAPPAPAAWAKLHRGTATIDVLQSPARKIGNEMVTVLKVKNTSPGAIALLKAEEFWYDKSQRIVTGDSLPPIRKPINPGEIVELTFRAPVQPDLYQSTYKFTHANGEVKATSVKKFAK